MLLAVLLAAFPRLSASVPVQTAVDPSWVPDPSGRGTWGLIQSCLITLYLCVYTALHLDIYPAKKPRDEYLRQFGWAIFASVAPEAVLVQAFRQWICARQMLKQINAPKAAVGALSTTFLLATLTLLLMMQ